MKDFKIMTWNVNSIKVRLNHLIELIDKYHPDVICLQELKCETDKFPTDELQHLPYNLYINGQKTYNGVAILSKIPADDVKYNFHNNPVSEEARFIEICCNTEMGYIRVISLYAPNGGDVNHDSNRLQTKLHFYDVFTQYINALKSFKEKLFICADYNIASFDIDVYDVNRMRDSICFTCEEKAKLRSILNSGFIDNFRIRNPGKKVFSWWDYRAKSFDYNKGMRIDSILSTSNATNNLSSCVIDDSFRSKEKPSDHAPVIAIYTLDHE